MRKAYQILQRPIAELNNKNGNGKELRRLAGGAKSIASEGPDQPRHGGRIKNKGDGEASLSWGGDKGILTKK